MMIRQIFLTTSLIVLSACASPKTNKTVPLANSSKTQINNHWLYLEKDSVEFTNEQDIKYSLISLPHTWNAIDSLETRNYRRAASWYRKYLNFSAADLEQRLYLKFGAAGQRAVVYVNGKKQMEHIGGYSAFTIELTHLVKLGKNSIDVMVTNKHDKTIAPLSGDFTMYGGLYRSVHLIKAPKTSFSKNVRSGPGFRVWSEHISKTSAEIKMTACIDRSVSTKGTFTIYAKLVDPNGKTVSTTEKEISVKASQITKINLSLPKVSNPLLWSPESPQLYKLTLALIKDGKVIDRVEENHGFRWYKFTADNGFFLNGKPYKLLGVNRHQDFKREGNALAPHRHKNDIELMKELGVNWLRLAHYQQDDYVLDLCDKMGLLVWEEIPYVDRTTFEPQFEKNLQSMIKDMIEQHYNHSSIILWGMGNEVRMKAGKDGKARCWNIINNLHKLVRKDDPSRKTVFVVGDADYASRLKVFDIPDVIGYNIYRGWYGAGFETFTARCQQLHRLNPDKPFIVSEFGAGCDQRIHTETPKRYDFSEEYQIQFLESHLDQIEKMDWLSGFNWWNFADFGSANRGDSLPHINQKGLITFDRTKKDSFYYTKARWSKEPVLYIQSPSWKSRTGKPTKEYRVFSNMNEVELFHNGVSLGKQVSGFRWTLTLKLGENTILAVGTSKEHTKKHSIKVNFLKDKEKYTVQATKEEKANPASGAVDGKNFTRWSANGQASITIDLEKISLLNSISINFYRGNTRQYKYKLSVATKKGQWKKIFEGKSSGKSQIDKVTFLQSEARYIKLDGYGNNENSWNSITEISPEISNIKKIKNQYEKIGVEANK